MKKKPISNPDLVKVAATPHQAGNIVAQLPPEAQRVGSGIHYVPDDADEKTGVEAGTGTLMVPLQWAAAAKAADPDLFVDLRPVPRSAITDKVIAQDKAEAFTTALWADRALNLRWMSSDTFPASDAALRAALTACGMDADATLAV